MAWDDRFSGEMSVPALWRNCENCGRRIYEGYLYYEHDDMVICTICAKDYAFAEFLKTAVTKTAEGDWP